MQNQIIGIIVNPDKFNHPNEFQIVCNYNPNKCLYYDYTTNSHDIFQRVMYYIDPYRVKNYLGQKTDWIKWNLQNIIAYILLVMYQKSIDPMDICYNGWS